MQPAGINCMLVFAKGGKLENTEKNLRSRVENQHKLNPLMSSGLGIELGPYWWEASTLATAFARVKPCFLYFNEGDSECLPW